MGHSYDVFVSHASEDKAEFVQPLVVALEARGLRVWYDAHQIRLGDDFRKKMDEGLRESRFGVVVISPSFRKYWPEAELSALFNQERVFEEKRVLPVVHGLTHAQVTGLWPLLAARAAGFSTAGPDALAELIFSAVRDEDRPERASPSRLYNVPQARSVHFAGRDKELAHLESMLRQGGPVRVAASVEGLAGIGKTELALQLAHRLAAKGAFPGGIYWLDAEKPDLAATWGQAIAEEMGLPMLPLADRAALAIRTVTGRGVPVLVVLDNVAEWKTSAQPGPLPSGPHVRLLVSTRRHRLGGALFQHCEVTFLPPPFDRNLLCAAAGPGRDLRRQKGFEALLRHLGGHALALDLAGAYLGEYPDTSPSDYLEKLEKDPAIEGAVTDLVRYEKTVTAALEATWDRLDEGTRVAWRIAARFEPEFASAALGDATTVDAEARRRLRTFHLIEIAADGRWKMHRLVRAFGRRQGTAEELRAAAAAFVAGSLERASAIDVAAGFRVYLPDRVHFHAALEAAPQALGERGLRVSILEDRIATALHSAGELRQARIHFENALADLESLGEDHPSVATSRANLASVLQDLGELPAARSLLEKALASDLKNLSEDHPSVATTRSNLAMVLRDLGELPAARSLLEKALASALGTLGEGHSFVATTRANLALVLQALGEFPAARSLLEKALVSALEDLGEDHPTVATRRANLASVLQHLGELPSARALLEQALASDLKNLGEDHPNVATSRASLALVLHDLGELPAARALLEKALASDLQNLGEDHPAVASVWFSLARIDLAEDKPRGPASKRRSPPR